MDSPTPGKPNWINKLDHEIILDVWPLGTRRDVLGLGILTGTVGGSERRVGLPQGVGTQNAGEDADATRASSSGRVPTEEFPLPSAVPAGVGRARRLPAAIGSGIRTSLTERVSVHR